jgi:hypothetical protein
MNRIRERKLYWIAGTAVALTGVATVRLVAPELTGLTNKTALIAGYLVSLAGITILAYAAKR